MKRAPLAEGLLESLHYPVNTARFHNEARLEFLDSVAYYEAIQVGLGACFPESFPTRLFTRQKSKA
jgi:hypothetical protein